MKVAILAEKYATDYTWYVDVILNLIRIAGDYVSDEVWFRVIQIVINRDDVQGYAAKTVFEVGNFRMQFFSLFIKLKFENITGSSGTSMSRKYGKSRFLCFRGVW